ncbi:Hypothetical protein R9X50_00626700 [Acrodontium crateriforme]|uniref:RRM domain-containing protein n=1 Tax=Acrodontium crateriforme TaxID=150365 RepID=A0AAQ3RDJ6_9PEZI|nr:Hypothetical protein R9X50_00626700 [Acrodontium crateriforme]
MSDQSRQKATVFVGGLDAQVTQQTLYDAFIPFGEIVDVSLPKPDLISKTSNCIISQSQKKPPTNKPSIAMVRPSSKDPHRGFGYIEFHQAEDAHEAIENMDQAELYGRVIKVNQAKPQKDANEGLGSRTAVWEQEGYAAKYNNDEGHAGEDDGGDAMTGLEGLDVAGPKLE